ncbi:DUF58 domain-containing protein [Corallococcus sp. AB004]|uniref:DUF58 domain-containing protein n=1 Tax=Corallococcus TaxID=83461 RepID=UPI000EA3283A|nr:DUF58 domain-containing protein [Corallococcus sp. AB038B]NPC68682.1 DUF58 domain-containing protein [Corallococcus exiguus]RKI33289.1 DUF58 domain-containing protein [Corallococcus sp. AB004]NPD27597.1 DUF58 domain-containing protein [Corallococcus exiguus]NRD50724.1 DUF58 domain-containing protein [Corallococcus exiguus]RKH98855.1 DUF58 domain-containing protein [Corallococcus sp. AB038B]
MLPKDLIRRIRKLEIRTRKVVSDMLAGQYHSVFKGRGMAFSEVRQYQPGDEIRFIDWNVTARMNEAYIKVFTEERELTVMLLVDVSASNEFGSKERTKAEVAAEVAAQIAFSAIANNDRVGLILFSDRVEKVVPPRKGRTHVLRLVSDILTFKPKGHGTDLSAGLTYLTQVSKRKAVTFLVSDFMATGYEKPLRLVGRRHDLVPVVIEDPLEQRFPAHGLVEMEDPETGERFVVDTSSTAVRGKFMRAMQAQRDERRKLFKKLELDHVELRAGDDHGKALANFFRARARRMAA